MRYHDVGLAVDAPPSASTVRGWKSGRNWLSVVSSTGAVRLGAMRTATRVQSDRSRADDVEPGRRPGAGRRGPGRRRERHDGQDERAECDERTDAPAMGASAHGRAESRRHIPVR